MARQEPVGAGKAKRERGLIFGVGSKKSAQEEWWTGQRQPFARAVVSTRSKLVLKSPAEKLWPKYLVAEPSIAPRWESTTNGTHLAKYHTNSTAGMTSVPIFYHFHAKYVRILTKIRQNHYFWCSMSQFIFFFSKSDLLGPSKEHFRSFRKLMVTSSTHRHTGLLAERLEIMCAKRCSSSFTLSPSYIPNLPEVRIGGRKGCSDLLPNFYPVTFTSPTKQTSSWLHIF